MPHLAGLFKSFNDLATTSFHAMAPHKAMAQVLSKVRFDHGEDAPFSVIESDAISRAASYFLRN